MYPTVMENAVRLGYGLVANHVMIDGHKRIGTHVMLLTITLNGIQPEYTQKELYDINSRGFWRQVIRRPAAMGTRARRTIAA